MLTDGRLDLSMTAQLGDALITLIKQDVQTGVSDGPRRRIEMFVLHAEAVVVRLAERQEAIRAEQATAQARRDVQATLLTDRITDLEQRIPVLLAAQAVLTERLHDARRLLAQDRAAFEHERTVTTQALADLHEQVVQAHARIAGLEARRLSARWARLVAWVRSLWR